MEHVGLNNRACIVGVGQTELSRHSGRSAQRLAVEATSAAWTRRRVWAISTAATTDIRIRKVMAVILRLIDSCHQWQ